MGQRNLGIKHQRFLDEKWSCDERLQRVWYLGIKTPEILVIVIIVVVEGEKTEFENFDF